MPSRHFYPATSTPSQLSRNPTHSLSDVFSALLSSLLRTLLTFTQPNSFTTRCLLSTSNQSPRRALHFDTAQLIHFQKFSQHFYPVAFSFFLPSHNSTLSLSDVFPALLSNSLSIFFTFTEPNSFTFRCLLSTF